MTVFRQLASLSQSLWYDNIQRNLLESGELDSMIARGEICGVTSNPSIFHNAIVNTNDYESALMPLALAGWDAETIFWQLAREDIQRACDLFHPVYEKTKGTDGYVSLEVHPELAHDWEATLAQVKNLWQQVNRPNLMIKIPATEAGLPAIKAAIAAGININVTLIFSIKRYGEVMEAYLSGLEQWFSSPLRKGDSVRNTPASVASFFVSRMDTKVDSLLPEDSPLCGKAAIANARLAYAAFRDTFKGPRWEKLAKQGARLQRPLWASTSTKNPAYSDTLYVDSLIGPDTVNTVPPQTLDAFRDHGKAQVTVTGSVDAARHVFSELESQGISIALVTRELELEGIQAFSSAFTSMLEAIEKRRVSVIDSISSLSPGVNRRIARLEAEAVPSRLWSGDPSLWSSNQEEQAEIRNRLGWLHLPESSRSRIKTIQANTDEIHKAGIRKVLLLGMGGSSLAPEVLSLVFKNHHGSADADNESSDALSRFAILDSTDPAQVKQAAVDFPPSESLYIVSSKSGGTAEVNAMLEYFWHLSDEGGSRFIAITDPGTGLDALAKARDFRTTLLADPSVGGRFSVLSDFGLFPMALMGMDLKKVLDSALSMMTECRAEKSAARNPGLVLGALMGEASLAGKNKLTLIADKQIDSFGSWLEQLIAESSGKKGKGIIVVDSEPLLDPAGYGSDRLFIYLKVNGEYDQQVKALQKAGHPVLELMIPDVHALIREFYRWEIATTTACHILGVNAFDQPDVQDNKERTRKKITVYKQFGRLEEEEPTWQLNEVKAFSNQVFSADNLVSLFTAFCNLAKQGDYAAINAYLPRNARMLAELTRLRLLILKKTGCATTLGFGPRFLHSTGQLHKGGPDTAIFLQITSDPGEDIEIPNQGDERGKAISFGVLERAQALGDFEALKARGRRILRLHLPFPEYIVKLVEEVGGTFG